MNLMTSILPESQNLLFSDMSYDKIDFADHLGNDDIDIDIDLEAGQNDGDYILEDVNSDMGHGEALTSNDDLMIDDDTASYPMDDVDTLQGEHVEMEDADLSDVPAVELHNPELRTIPDGNESAHLAGVDDASEIVIGGLDTHEEPLRHIDAEQLHGEQAPIEETTSSDKRTVDTDSTLLSPTITQLEPSIQTTIDQRILPPDPTYSHLLGTDPGNKYPGDAGATSEIISATEQAQGELEIEPSTDNNTILAAAKVVVIYRQAEYLLCSSSESDDPDTFFLKDINLVNGSLADLLNGLREVIHEDLGSEDELCLAAEDLGIEISETCMSVHEVTFASIISLHERLLRNDGVETPGPLYVTLGTKPDFAKRLANLATGAAEGKGLSDFVSWDEESDELEGQIGEKQQDKASEENSETSNALTQNHKSDLTNESVPKEEQLENVEIVQNPGSKSVEAAQLGNQDEEQITRDHDQIATSDGTSHVTGSLGQGTINDNSSATHTTEISEYSKDGLDEDGDLIDYEDEEYEQNRETSASANVDSSGTQNEKASALAQGLPYAPEEDARPVDEENDNYTGYQENEEYQGDNSFAHELTGDENVQNDEELHVSYEGIQDENEGDDGNVLQDIAVNTQELFDSSEPGYQQYRTKDTEGDATEKEHNPTGPDSLGFGETDQLVTPGPGAEEYDNFENDPYDGGNDEISYEEVDNPDSNESERTLTADESAPHLNPNVSLQEHEDEINYDTDDEHESTQHTEQKAGYDISPTMNGHTGKRQRTDGEDVTDMASNPDSKRARS